MNNFIYGGVNVFGGAIDSVTQVGSIVVNVGDFKSLSQALIGLEIPEQEIEKLKGAISEDRDGFGARTKKWMAAAAKTVGSGGAKVGTAVGTELLKEMLSQYFGLK